MKRKFTQTGIGFVLSFMMLSMATHAAETKKDDPKEKKETKKAKVTSSRNNSSVRIYPDIVRRVMHVEAKNDKGAGIDFFVFNTDSTMVMHFKMKSGDHEDISGLERGKYVFRVFSGDTETAMGNIEIR